MFIAVKEAGLNFVQAGTRAQVRFIVVMMALVGFIRLMMGKNIFGFEQFNSSNKAMSVEELFEHPPQKMQPRV